MLISEISGVDRWEGQISEHVQRLAGDLAYFVSARGMLVWERILEENSVVIGAGRSTPVQVSGAPPETARAWLDSDATILPWTIR